MRDTDEEDDDVDVGDERLDTVDDKLGDTDSENNVKVKSTTLRKAGLTLV